MTSNNRLEFALWAPDSQRRSGFARGSARALGSIGMKNMSILTFVRILLLGCFSIGIAYGGSEASANESQCTVRVPKDLLAVPYYLLRSRERGQRLFAMAKLLGFVVLMVAALVVGALPVAVVS
jgi:hypothetical protein